MKCCVALALLLLFSGNAFGGSEPEFGDPVVANPPQAVEDRFIPDPDDYTVQAWVENLQIPWSLVFLSDKKALVTERPGRIRLIANGVLQDDAYKVLEDVEHIGEGGLMGITKHPGYPEQPYLFLMYTYREAGKLYNRVARFEDTGQTLLFDQVLLEKIPGHRVHNGGRIGFGPDGMLYITTGDIWQAELAQDKNSLAGKILRLTPDGHVPEDNPFQGSPVYSLGHRNPQGLAWHPNTNSLFSSEHGPSGEFGLQDKDIINVIEKGGNYGWPLVLGKADIDPYIDPIIMWPQATPPSGITFWNSALYVATLRSEALIRINTEQRNNSYEITAVDRLFAADWFSGTYGRLRDVVPGPDNALYILTSNRDGRGTPREGDDKMLKLKLKY